MMNHKQTNRDIGRGTEIVHSAKVTEPVFNWQERECRECHATYMGPGKQCPVCGAKLEATRSIRSGDRTA